MLYGRTNKKDAMKQVAKQYSRKTVLRDPEYNKQLKEREELARAPLDIHHIVSPSRNNPINIYNFVRPTADTALDPAKQVICFIVTVGVYFFLTI